MSPIALPSAERIRIGARLKQLRDRQTKENREDGCREIAALRQTIRDYDTAVRKGRASEALSSTGVATTVVGPFFLFAGSLAAAAGLALTIA